MEAVWVTSGWATKLLPIRPSAEREPTEHSFFLNDVCIGRTPCLELFSLSQGSSSSPMGSFDP